MRTERLAQGWRVTGRIAGAGRVEMTREAELPWTLADMEPDCSREGLFLRVWELSRVVERPKEPPHSHAERTLLTLDGICGEGELLVDGQPVAALTPQMEIDLSESLRDGGCLVTLRFPPRAPLLYPGERGSDLPVEVGLMEAGARSVYLLRIERIEVKKGLVRVHLYAYGSGKVRLCLRLMEGDALRWSENVTVKVRVGREVIEREFAADCACGVMRVTADMGGEGCDEASAPYGCLEAPGRAVAHFRALPSEEMLAQIKGAGFDAAALHTCACTSFRFVCARLGLRLIEQPPSLNLRVLLRPGSEEAQVQEEECLVAPLSAEDDAQQFVQAEKLRRAALLARIQGRQAHFLALGRQRDAQDGLFSADGEARMALAALREALGKTSVAALPLRPLCCPGGTFEAEVYALSEADGSAVTLNAQLYSWDGVQIAARSFPVCLHTRAQCAGTLRAALPWDLRGGLLMRLQCWKGGALMAQSHAYCPCADEEGRAQPFPLADIAEESGEGVRELYNASDAVAAGVTVRCGGKVLLRYGALLPMERIELAHQGEVVVQYGNPIQKGGAAIVSQRILRGVFSHSYSAPDDTQVGNR